jgi:cell division protein FtsN
MPKDYKDTPARAAPPSRVHHPMLLGVIIGLLLGIVISLAVALWLNRLANPFVEKSKAPEPLPKIAPAQPPPPAEAAKAAEQTSKKAQESAKPGKASDRPRFEFYQILPGEREAGEKEAKAAPPKTAAVAPPAKPGSSPLTPKPHSGDVYWLQAGAFSEEREADNLKAKIALTGLEASVRPVNIPEKGTLFRVRLGPYQSLDDANRIKNTLSQNGVGTAIIRVAEDSKPQ